MSRRLCRPNVSMSTVAESAAAAGRSTAVVYVHHAYFLQRGKPSGTSERFSASKSISFYFEGLRSITSSLKNTLKDKIAKNFNETDN